MSNWDTTGIFGCAQSSKAETRIFADEKSGAAGIGDERQLFSLTVILRL